MGEYAEYALASAMRSGSPVRPRGELRHRSVARPCPACERPVRGGFNGMVDHLKAKHGIKDKAARQIALAVPESAPIPNPGAEA